MPPGLSAAGRWAAEHAATVTASGFPSGGDNPAAAMVAAPQTTPVVIASITEIQTWRTEDPACGVSVCTAPDGRLLLAVGEFNGTVRIWHPETGELLQTLAGHDEPVYMVAWSIDEDGRPLLATGSNDGAAQIWITRAGELARGSRIVAAEDRQGPVDSLSWGYAADGRRLLAIGTDRGTWIWDQRTGDRRHATSEAEGPILAVAWAAGQRTELLLVEAADAGAVRICDTSTGQALHVLECPGVRSVAWTMRAGEPLKFVTIGSRDAERFVPDTAIRVWRQGDDGAFTAESVDLQQGDLRMVSPVPLPDGRMLIAGNSDDSLFVLDGSTLELLHAEPLNFGGRGLQNLDWAVTPGGSLLLCATSNPDRVHVWNITLDPPVPVPAPSRPASAGEARAEADQRGRLVIPPEDVTPHFHGGEDEAGENESPPRVDRVSCAVRADGHILAATGRSDGRVAVWDISAGTLLHTATSQPAGLDHSAWGRMPDGRLLLITANQETCGMQVWDSSTWQLVAAPSHQPAPRSQSGGVSSLAWIHDGEGRPLLASGGSSSGTVCVQDPESGVVVRSFPMHEDYIDTIAEGRLADGRRCLLTTNWHAPARLWDADTGERIFEFASSANAPEGANQTWSAAWGHGPDGRPMIAVGSDDHAVRIWDPGNGELVRTFDAHDGEVYSVLWPDHPGWPSIIVSADGVGRPGGVWIWDPGTGAELAKLPHSSPRTYAIDIVLSPNGDLLLVTAAGGHPPVRIWRIATGLEITGGAGSGPRVALSTYRAAWLTKRLLSLGDGGLWPPLGLLADLVTLTSPAAVPRTPDDGSSATPGLHDSRLAALDHEPGIGLLRELAAGQPGWDDAARVAFAALLLSTLDIPARYIPPAEADPASLRGELAGTLAAQSGGYPEASASIPEPWRVPVAGLRKAAAAITDQTVTLLRILGPDACAANPLLPLQLAHHVPRLPVLSPHELRLLTAADGYHATGGRAMAAGTLVYSPGTVGIARSGPPSRLLPTQLALPRDLLTVRLAEDQLLYRQHRAPTPLAPSPVTVILDTTPPTFGPAGQALRLVTHLIATTLWPNGRYPCLITLTAPGTVTQLRTPADLVSVWASTTLDDPLPALAAALETATVTGQPAVFCTHHHTARAGYAPGPLTRLLTTHQPPEQPPRPPTSRWHVHLPPRPTREQLTAAIGRLLIPRAEDIA